MSVKQAWTQGQWVIPLSDQMTQAALEEHQNLMEELQGQVGQGARLIDEPCWKWEKSRQFTVKSCYKAYQ